MQKNRNPPPFHLVWAWEMGSNPTSRPWTSFPISGGRLVVERSGFQMGRSQEGHDTSLHPEEGWGLG